MQTGTGLYLLGDRSKRDSLIGAKEDMLMTNLTILTSGWTLIMGSISNIITTIMTPYISGEIPTDLIYIILT
jgi:hypothetical protein